MVGRGQCLSVRAGPPEGYHGRVAQQISPRLMLSDFGWSFEYFDCIGRVFVGGMTLSIITKVGALHCGQLRAVLIVGLLGRRRKRKASVFAA